MGRSPRGPLLALVLACSVAPLKSTEAHWIAKNADAVAVGRFSDFQITPLRSNVYAQLEPGWRLTGTLLVDESLFGPISNGARLPYEWDCRRCPTPSHSARDMLKRNGLWFIRRLNGRWASAGSEIGDPGYRLISEREFFATYLRERSKTSESSK